MMKDILVVVIYLSSILFLLAFFAMIAFGDDVLEIVKFFSLPERKEIRVGRTQTKRKGK